MDGSSGQEESSVEGVPTFFLDGVQVDLMQFLADNADGLTATQVERIWAMEPGEEMVFGGGAGAAFVFSRASSDREMVERIARNIEAQHRRVFWGEEVRP